MKFLIFNSRDITHPKLAVLREIDVLTGRFFLSLGTVATILACTLVLGERLTFEEWVGIVLIMLGVMLVGRW